MSRDCGRMRAYGEVELNVLGLMTSLPTLDVSSVAEPRVGLNLNQAR